MSRANTSTDVPPALRPRAISAMRGFVETTTDHPARLRTTLRSDRDRRNRSGRCRQGRDDGVGPAATGHKLDLHFIRPALVYLHEAGSGMDQRMGGNPDGRKASFTATRNGCPSRRSFPTTFWRTYLHRLETEDLERSYFDGMIEVIAARADAKTFGAGVREAARATAQR